ncbi:MAG: radical SAM protein [Caldilineaceae bacterium]|nr:radical SAM protein [Caldilineaceae bacterium]
MHTIERIARHARITANAYAPMPDPTFLVLFINSICNMKCEHCFYWTSLNKRDDLSAEEIFALSRSLGRLENLNLSGGEPFLRKEFAEICRHFVQHNQVRQIYVPSNGYFTDKMVAAVNGVLEEEALDLFVVELSLDGMPEFHDTFRVAKHAFRHAMESYDALAEIQQRDPRLRIHAISTATDVNIDQIRQLTTYLYERCPQMDHHNLAIIRGDRKNPNLAAPLLGEYEKLYEYIRSLWQPREQGRYGAIVEPLLQWAKMETLKQQRQVVPCAAGRLSAVVYANGDVSVCEMHEPIGNLRSQSFPEIWQSERAKELRRRIAAKECYCTTEVFLWPSVVYQPASLVKAMAGSRPWRSAEPLGENRVAITLDDQKMPVVGD